MKRQIMSKFKYILIFSAVAILAVVLDQVTKAVMGKALEGGKIIPVIGNWLTFRWVLNDGGAFGQLSGMNVLFFVTTIIGLPAFTLMFLRARTRSLWGQIGFCFMIGGTLGNAIDRLMLAQGFFDGAVRDFISVSGFAVFNVADSFLVVGVIMVCLALLIFDHDAILRKSNKAGIDNNIDEQH